jgi:hypothetical protein
MAIQNIYAHDTLHINQTTTQPLSFVHLPSHAIEYAAEEFARLAHQGQCRKGPGDEPYFKHVQEVGIMLKNTGHTSEIVAAGFLHDTVEDCAHKGITFQSIQTLFGEKIAHYVKEVSDDKSCPKKEQKEQCIKNAFKKSQGASAIILADKTSNLKSIALCPPLDWSMQRKLAYVEWSISYIMKLPFHHESLLVECVKKAFDASQAILKEEAIKGNGKAQAMLLTLDTFLKNEENFKNLKDAIPIEKCKKLEWLKQLVGKLK